MSADKSHVEVDSWWSPTRFSLLLAAIIFLAFPQVVIGLESFIVRDFGFFAYPLASFQRECFWRGELPFWNPYNFCGIPFLAQWNTMALYPPALMYLLLPLQWALSCFCLVHLLFAGLGCYFLAHRWTGNRFAASVAGLAFAFNGMALNLLMWPSHIATFSWVPWVVWLVERAWERGGRSLFVAALAASMQMLAGGPETIALTWLLLATLWVIRLWRGKRARSPHGEPCRSEIGDAAEQTPALRLALLWRFPAVALLVACLAAAQLLPFLELAAHSQRGHGYSDTTASMPLSGWANFLVPMVFGSARVQHMFFQHWQSWTSSYYMGVAILLLACFSVVTLRLWRVRLLALSSLLALIAAPGAHSILYRWLTRLVPALGSVSHPVKFLLVTTFAAPLLAAYAIAAQESKKTLDRRSSDWGRTFIALAAALLAATAGILLWAWLSPFPWDDFAATFKNGLTRMLFLIAGAVMVLAMRRCDLRRRRWLETGLLLLLWFDVWTHEPQQNPTAPPAIFNQDLARKELAMNPQPDLGSSRAMVTPEAQSKFLWVALDEPKDDYLAKRLGYCADCNLLDHVPKVDGFFSLYPLQCAALSALLYATNADYPAIEDLLGVSQIIAKGEVVKWDARSTYLPFVTAGQRTVVADDISALRVMVAKDFNPRGVTFLATNTPPSTPATEQTQADVSSLRVTAQQIDFDIDAKTAPSVAVISQTYYPAWRAWVDGQPSTLLRADFALQAVQVPAGHHHVRLIYRDSAFFIGAAISLVSLVCCIGGIFFKRPRVSHANLT